MICVKKLRKTLRHLFHPHKSNRHRAHLLHPEALFVLFLLAGAFLIGLHLVTAIPSFSNILGFASSISAEEVVAQTNARRASEGLPPLQFNSQLATAAMTKGQDMFAKQYWSHTSPAGVQPWAFIQDAGYNYTVAGENLARDFADTGSMMQAWMESPTHRANIVNAKYQEIGVAVINGELEGYDTTLVVQMFGTARQQAAAVPVAGTSTENKLVPEVQAQEITPTAAVQEIAPAVPEAGTSGVESSFTQIDLTHTAPAFTPLMITKALFMGIALLIMFTLAYDVAVVGHRHALRVVGKNLAHFLLLGMVMYLIVFFKAGVIG